METYDKLDYEQFDEKDTHDMKFDFHMHSTYSDGSSTPEDIFKQAEKIKMSAIAITDHDTVLNYNDVNLLSKKYNIPFVPGIEMTAVEEGIKFHILGYGINMFSDELIKYSKSVLDFLNKKSIKQIEMLKKKGINIAKEEYFKECQGGPLYRAKFLNTLCKFGYFKREEIMQLLKKYFGNDGLCFVEDEYKYNNFNEVCRLIKENNGIVVLAHPAKIKKKSLKLYKQLINSNKIDGIELYHPSIDNETRMELIDVIKKKNLICTGGSDYHGVYNKLLTPICGVSVPYIVYEDLYKYLKNC